jgi:hypothetical protein
MHVEHDSARVTSDSTHVESEAAHAEHDSVPVADASTNGTAGRQGTSSQGVTLPEPVNSVVWLHPLLP